MSALAYIQEMTIHKLGHLGDDATQAIVNFDPITASEVDITKQVQRCRDLAAKLAEAEGIEAKDHKAMDDLQIKLTANIQAAHVIGDQLAAAQTAGETVKAKTIEAQLNTVMDQVEGIGGKEADGSVSGTLFNAIQVHAHSETKLHEWQQVHGAAVAQRDQAKALRAGAIQALHEAQDAETQAKQRQAQATADAGLMNASGTSTALATMQKIKDDAETRARAAIIDADSFTPTSQNADDIVKAALASTVAPVSALDRLARLKATA